VARLFGRMPQRVSELSREEEASVARLRLSPLAESIFSFASFAALYGESLALPRFTCSDLERSLVTPLTRPLCVALLLRLVATTAPERGVKSPPPVTPPREWEERLAASLKLEEGQDAADSWLGARDPLEGQSFFDAQPAQRLQLLVELAESRAQGGLAELIPASRLAEGLWHGAPLGSTPAGTFYAVPMDGRVFCEAKGKWTVAAAGAGDVKALASRLSAEGGAASVSSALLRSLLPPIDAAAAKLAAAAAEAAEARAERSASLLKHLEAATSRATSLRTATLEEGLRRAQQAAEEEAFARGRAAAEEAAMLEAKRRDLRVLIPPRFHSRAWEDALYAAAGLPSLAQAPRLPPGPEGEAAVGRRVSVFWPAEADWFIGTVKSFTASSKAHRIEYEDGDKESIILSHEAVAWL